MAIYFSTQFLKNVLFQKQVLQMHMTKLFLFGFSAMHGQFPNLASSQYPLTKLLTVGLESRWNYNWMWHIGEDKRNESLQNTNAKWIPVSCYKLHMDTKIITWSLVFNCKLVIKEAETYLKET